MFCGVGTNVALGPFASALRRSVILSNDSAHNLDKHSNRPNAVCEDRKTGSHMFPLLFELLLDFLERDFFVQHFLTTRRLSIWVWAQCDVSGTIKTAKQSATRACKHTLKLGIVTRHLGLGLLRLLCTALASKKNHDDHQTSWRSLAREMTSDSMSLRRSLAFLSSSVTASIFFSLSAIKKGVVVGFVSTVCHFW